MNKRIIMVTSICMVLLFGVSAYLKLVVFGWDEEFSLAVGMIHVEVNSESDAKIIEQFSDSFSTASTKEIKLNSGITKKESDSSYVVRLMLDGSSVKAKGQLSLNPIGVTYHGKKEDEQVINKIKDYAVKRGVKSHLVVKYINTPISVVMNQ